MSWLQRLLHIGTRYPASIPALQRPAPPQVGPSLFVMTEAGISAESGIPTYRGNGGLWRGIDAQDVASADAFEADPTMVATFYDERRTAVAAAQPNAAHLALTELQRRWPGTFRLVTTNVDDLHERAGFKEIHHLHGSLCHAKCARCASTWSLPASVSLLWAKCPMCLHAGPHRPDVVFFGEEPHDLDGTFAALDRCDIFVAIGCGGAVFPASKFPRRASDNKWRSVRQGKPQCHVIEINPEPTLDPAFNEVIIATASEAVPRWCEDALAGRLASSSKHLAVSAFEAGEAVEQSI